MSSNLHQGPNGESRVVGDEPAGRMDGLAALLCDGKALVLAATPQARALLEDAGPLALDAGVLTARARPDLADIIRLVASGQSETRILLLRRDSGPTLVLTITALGNLGPARETLVLVTTPAPRPAEGDPDRVLRTSFGLTRAEAAIAMHLARGAPRKVIAMDRGVSPGTLKSQIKSIYLKVGVVREAELATCLASLV